MRLILRNAAGRLGDDESLVIAASPDSLARQPWQWDVRLSREPVGQSLEHDGAGIGRHFVCVRVDPDHVAAELTTQWFDLDADRTVSIGRPVDELWLAVVETGSFRHGHLDVAPGDVLVWEGDDPVMIDVTPIGPGRVTWAVVTLRRTDGQALRWVP
jgi:hypothetical protein